MMRIELAACWAVVLACTMPCGAASAASEAEEIKPTATAETPAASHHFGVMQPNEVASHSFLVRNTGGAVLKLETPQGSCRCLQMRVDKPELIPGDEGSVYVRWRASEKAGEPFRQTVRVKTNDPSRPVLEFVIGGEVGGHLNLSPTRVEWKNARAGVAKETTVRLSTSHWPELHLSGLSSTLPGLQVVLQEGQPGVSPGTFEKASRVLRITAPAEMTESGFSGLITMTVSPTAKAAGEDEMRVAPHRASAALQTGPSEQASSSGGSEGAAALSNDLPAVIQIPVSLQLAPALSLVGAGYDEREKRIHLGAHKASEQLLRKYLIKVQDPQKSLALVDKHVIPSAVEVGFEPYRPEKGLYRLELRLPPGSLDRGYIGKQAGKLELEFDHPRAKRLEFALEVSPGH